MLSFLLQGTEGIATQWGIFTHEHLQMMLWILLLPLIAFGIQVFVGRWLPRQGDWLPTGAMFGSLVLSLMLLGKAMENGSHELLLHSGRPPGGTEPWAWNWLFSSGGEGNFVFAFLFDNLTAVMLVVVSMVSFLVHFFSIGYMKGEARYNRYFAHLAIFSFAMLGVVLSANLISLLICWELMGLSSYLLIGFYFERKSAADACKKAFMTTRVGDLGMLIGILMVWGHFGTMDILEVFEAAAEAVSKNDGLPPAWMTVAGLLIFCGPIGKSAQFPLHIWLPDAMEGPTPVSALIHAATMVAAGVFVIARLFPFFLFIPDALLIVALLGAFTAIFAATIGLTQFDIKKVLAYSTVSQLGFMVCALGCGALAAGTMHLMTHAWFKGCLFLCSGSVIHAMHHRQDMREMGGLRKKMPVTYLTMLVSTMAIAGVPLFSGFYSKDAIIAATLNPQPGYPGLLGGQAGYGFLWSLPSILIPAAAFMTAFYMFRLIIITFHGKPRTDHAGKAHESSWTMTLPLVVLAVLGVFGASPWIFNFDLLGHHIWYDDLVVRMDFENGALSLPRELPEAHHGILPLFISILVSGGGILLAFLVYQWRKISAQRSAEALGAVYRTVYNKYYVDEFVIRFIVRPLVYGWNVWCAAFDMFVVDGIVNGSARTVKKISFGSGWWDLNIVDGFVNLVAFFTQVFGAIARIFQTGFLQHYLTALGMAAVLGLVWLGGGMSLILLASLPLAFFGFVFLAKRA